MRVLSLACACLMIAVGAASQNLVTNGSFSGSLSPWATGSVSAYDATLDATGVSGSGSAKILAHPVTGVSGVSQCVAIAASTQYKGGAKILIPSGQATTGFGYVSCYLYATTDCRGAYLTAASSDHMGAAGSWVAKDTGFLTSPADAQSALVIAEIFNQGAAGSPDLQVNFDDMYLVAGGSASYSYHRWIPAVIHKDVPSKNAKWRSDVAILIHSTSSASLTITMHTALGGPQTKTYQMAGNTQILVPDVANWLGVTADSGPLEVTSDQEFFLSGRTYNQVDATHTYGQGYDGQEPSELLGANDSAWLPQLTENALYRTNIGITNTGTTTANVTLTLYDAAGNHVWTDARDYAPAGFYQYQQPYLALGGIASGYAEVTANSGSGVVAYASLIDNNTGDPTTITMKR